MWHQLQSSCRGAAGGISPRTGERDQVSTKIGGACSVHGEKVTTPPPTPYAPPTALLSATAWGASGASAVGQVSTSALWALRGGSGGLLPLPPAGNRCAHPTASAAVHWTATTAQALPSAFTTEESENAVYCICSQAARRAASKTFKGAKFYLMRNPRNPRSIRHPDTT